MPLKVLLADDNMTAQNMGRKILADAGFEVIAVSNGSAALKKFAEHRPDLLVLDVYMPGYSGLEVCEKIKMRSPRAGVLLTVGKMEMFHPEDVRRVRADGVVVKPFEATDLLAAVNKLAEAMPSKNGRHLGPNPRAHDDSEETQVDCSNGKTNGKAVVVPPPDAARPEVRVEDFVTTTAPSTAREGIPAAEVAPVNIPAVEAVEPPMGGVAEAQAVSSYSGAALAVISSEAESVPAESTDHEALIARFSAMPVKYVAPVPETPAEAPAETRPAEIEKPAEIEREDKQWGDEAVRTAAVSVGTPVAAVAQEAQTREASSASEVASAEPAVVFERAAIASEEGEPESYWVAVRVPLHSAPVASSASSAAEPKTESETGSAASAAENGINASAKKTENPATTQPADTPSGVLMENWLQEQTPVSISPAGAEAADDAAAHTQITAPSAGGELPSESVSTPVLHATEQAQVDAAAVEAAREGAGRAVAAQSQSQSQSDEITQAVERALSRFRETLIEEIARELEKRQS